MLKAPRLVGAAALAAIVIVVALNTPWINASDKPSNAAPAGQQPVNIATATIHWVSGDVAIPLVGSQQAAADLATFAAGGVNHVVVQFAGPVTPAERTTLAAAGVQLLRYVGDNAFFAAIDGSRFDNAALAQHANLAAAVAIQRDWKLHPGFIDGVVYDWMVVQRPKTVKNGAPPEPVTAADNPRVGVYVLFHPDVDLDGAAGLVRLYGGWIRSELRSINGLVVELPYQNVYALADEDAVQWIEPPLPKFSPTNNSNRARVGADIVHQPPYGLDGTGVVALIYDGGTADHTHPDFGGRLTEHDASGVHYHSTHVAGTVGGDGTSSGGTYAGMAPNCTMVSYGYEQEGGLHEGFLYTDPGDIEHDYHEAIATYDADIANNSIGTNTAPNGFDCTWEGNYGATGELIDTIVRGDGSNPLFDTPFRIVWANGNERQTTRCLGIEGFESPYHSTAPPACAKNHITVGALNSNDDSVTDFTSFGPADDGRLKPDISAPGCQSDDDGGVTSCNAGGGYTTLCGTSMASPTVCGLGVLLLQDFRQQYPGEPDFRNSTLKVLLAHTAADIQNPGPDYQTGYGSVRVQPADDLLRSGNFLEAEVDQGQAFSVLVVANPGDTQIKVTLAWDDAPGTPNVNPVLVNDLDLRVFDSGGTQYYPWTLDMNNPSAPAVRTQADHINNIEQVVIDNPTPGAYRIEVYGYNVPAGPQPFSLAATPMLVACSSQGTISLDRTKYACTATATVQVVDCDLNTDDGVVETVDVNIASDTDPTGLTLTLTETGPETAAFRATVDLNESGGAGVLQIADGDTVTATYIDADDGQGGSNVTVTQSSLVDCSPPVISNVQVTDINPRDATITFDTDEDTNAVIHYGLACDALTETAQEGGFRSTHSIRLSGLTDATTYFFSIDAEDEAGNATTDDNGGACYTFTTPDIPDFFTEEFGGDNDLDNKSLLFTPNGTVDFYAGCVEDITALPTDPAGGTTITLSDDDSELITLTGGAQVYLYGVAYNSVYVGSNGYLTFGASDTTYTESASQHFAIPRISALFDDLNPSSAGTVSYKQLADRLVVTYQNVPEYSTSDVNTFQIEMYFNGDITISYLTVDATDGLAGLSAGHGVDPDYYETDLSAMGSCGPRPPTAQSAAVSTPQNNPLSITLGATDDGLPDPPGALVYIVTALPAHGSLSDPGAGPIDSVPYTLAAGGNVVDYQPEPWYLGADSFTFKANDGGTPPDGGDSNEAVVSIDVTPPPPVQVYSFPLDSDPGWSVEGQWAFGVPTGGGTHNGDPTSGHTGVNVYGYNLGGDYSSNMPAYSLTTTAIDCSELTSVELRFWRWLGVESSTFDHASVEVSRDGSNWTTVWSNPSSSTADTSWTQQTFDISAVADGQATVYVRWTMGPTDGSVTYPGWNVDDVEIWAAQTGPQLPGDLDGDCDVDLSDLAILLAHYDQGGGMSYQDGDIDGDGDVDLADLAILLANYGQTCP